MPKTKKYLVTYTRVGDLARNGRKAQKYSVEVEATSGQKACDKVSNSHRVVHGAKLVKDDRNFVDSPEVNELAAATAQGSLYKSATIDEFMPDTPDRSATEVEEPIPDPIESVTIAEGAEATEAATESETPSKLDELVALVDTAIQTRFDTIKALTIEFFAASDAHSVAVDAGRLLRHDLNEEEIQAFVNGNAIDLLKDDAGAETVEALLDYVPSTTHEATIELVKAQISENTTAQVNYATQFTNAATELNSLAAEVENLQSLRTELVGEKYEEPVTEEKCEGCGLKDNCQTYADNHEDDSGDLEDEDEEASEIDFNDAEIDDDLQVEVPNWVLCLVTGIIVLIFNLVIGETLLAAIGFGIAATVVAYVLSRIWERFHTND